MYKVRVLKEDANYTTAKNTKENAPRRVKKFVEIRGTFIRISAIESIVIIKASIINKKNTLNVFTTGSERPFYFYGDTLEQVEEMAQELLNACEEE